MAEITKQEIDELERSLLPARVSLSDLQDADFQERLECVFDIARAHLEARESAGELVKHLPANAGICAADWDECTVTVAFDTEEDARAVYSALPARNRVRLCDDLDADTIAAQQQEIARWRQPYVHCFTCGAPASKVIHLPEGCAAQPDVQGIVGICPQHEHTIEPSEQYHVLCDLTATTPDALAAVPAVFMEDMMAKTTRAEADAMRRMVFAAERYHEEVAALGKTMRPHFLRLGMAVHAADARIYRRLGWHDLAAASYRKAANLKRAALAGEGRLI